MEEINGISETIPATNFRITDDELGQGTAKEKFRANIMAIQLLKKCEDENRNATPEAVSYTHLDVSFVYADQDTPVIEQEVTVGDDRQKVAEEESRERR